MLRFKASPNEALNPPTSRSEDIRGEVVTVWSLLVPSHALSPCLCLGSGSVVHSKPVLRLVAGDICGCDGLTVGPDLRPFE